MSELTPNQWPRVFAAVGVGCVAVEVAVLLSEPPAAGYEISIYRALPLYFWIAAVGAIVSGQLVLLTSAVSDGGDETAVVGVALMGLTVVTLTLVPYVRGYPLYGRADVLTHLGLVADLSRNGISGNIYPPMHIVVQGLSGATGLAPRRLINLLPVAFTVVFLGSMYRLVTALFADRRQVLFTLPFVLFPLLGASHVLAVPYVVSLLLTPFALALLVLERWTSAVAVRGMLALAVVGVVLYHPLVGLFLVMALVLYAAAERVIVAGTGSRSPTAVTSFTFVVFAAWYLSIVGILIRFRIVVTDFLGPGGDSELQGTVNTIDRTGAQLVDVASIALLKYGDTAVIYGLSTVLLAAVATWWIRDRDRPGRFTAAFGTASLLFAGLSVVFLTNDLIVGFGRPLAFGKLFAAVLAGGFGYTAWTSADSDAARAAVGVGLSAVFLVVVVLAVAGMFSSPMVAEKNQQVTRMDLDGMDWTLDRRNEALRIEEFGIEQYRYRHLRRGVGDPSPTIRRENTLPPDHFNYTRYGTLGRSYRSDHYLVLTRLGRITYPEKFPAYRNLWRFTPADFRQLQYDPTVGRIYDNGEFETYLIDGTGPPDSGQSAAGRRARIE